MKKQYRILLSLLLAAIFTLSMGTIAFAAHVEDECDPMAGCSHPRLGTRLSYDYEYDNNVRHKKFTIEWVYCLDCNYSFGGVRTGYVYQNHTTNTTIGTWVGSSHIGNYQNHTYTYSYPCEKCPGRFTRDVKSWCTPGQCIDPR